MEERVIQVPFKINQDWVDDVMCTAFEGGINYWCYNVDVKDNDLKGAEWKSEVVSRGGIVILELTEPFDDEDTEFYELTLDKLLEGFKKYIEWSVKVGRTFCTDPADIDATEADCIIQLALFGEVVFG